MLQSPVSEFMSLWISSDITHVVRVYESSYDSPKFTTVSLFQSVNKHVLYVAAATATAYAAEVRDGLSFKAYVVHLI